VHVGEIPDRARSIATLESVPVRAGLAAKAHRTTGHAAEMAFFAVLTLVPSTVAVGAMLGISEALWIIGENTVAHAEDASVTAVQTLMGPDLTKKVISPFIHAQLAQPRGGVALGSLLVAWWLSSHLFMSTAHALDTINHVRDRRPGPLQRVIALAFALASVGIVSMTVELMVTLPGLLWAIVRWPVLLAVIVAFLACLYRYCPSVRQRWREVLPGACVGAGLWILAAVAFRLTAGLRGTVGVPGNDPNVALVGQAVNAVVATVLWAYLASIAILLGAEFNAAYRARRRDVA
jgi:membrane protein